VQQATYRSSQRFFVRSCRERVATGGVEEVGPAFRAGVDVGEVEAGLVEVPGQADAGSLAAQ